MNRRRFLQRLGLSSLTAFSAGRIVGANNRVNVALIGCGGRGNLVGKLMKAVPDVDFIALCDVFDDQILATKEWAGANCKVVRDFRRVLEMKDVDAVLIATPDHWHAIPAVLACEAGKDVYVEKPIGYSIKEGRKIVEAVKKNKRVLQVGTQHRSAPHYNEAQEIVQRGDLGKVRFVRIWNYVNMYPKGIGRVADSEPPAGADWDFYLGPAPARPFNRNRFIRTYRWFWDYAGGLVTDFGTHRFDSMHQVIGADSPLTVNATGRRSDVDDGAETPDFIQITYEYPNFVMSYEASMLNSLGVGGRTKDHTTYGSRGEWDRPHGEAFYGTNGALFSTRTGYEIFPEMTAASGPGAADREKSGFKTGRKIVNGADRTDLHVANFIDCVRTRKTPIADAETGHRSSLIAHLGNISYRVGRKLKWDAKSEQIIGDAEANAMLWREPRKQWDII